MQLSILDLAAQGDGIAKQDGRSLFIPGTLPGEVVTVTPTSDPTRPQLDQIITPSPMRAAPPCPHFLTCGGCKLQHMTWDSMVQWKHSQLETLLVQSGIVAHTSLPGVTTQPQTRRRARLAAFHGKRGLCLGFHRYRSDEVIDITACPVLTPALQNLLPRMRETLTRVLPKGANADFQLTALPGGIDMVMIGGFAKLDLDARLRLGDLATALPEMEQFSWRKWDQSPIEPIAHKSPLGITFGETTIAFPPGSFLQATQTGQDALIGFAQNVAQETKAEKLADLFCGLGGFGLSIPAAERFFTDIDGPAITALGRATHTTRGVTCEHHNLAKSGLNSAFYGDFDLVLFDPPRGGAKNVAATLAQSSTPHIVAVSCDPPSFVRDALLLMDGGYQLQRLLPVDQFLYASHLELAAWFTR